MKKNNLVVIFLVILVTACNNDKQKNTYTLTGTVANKGDEGKMVFLDKLDSAWHKHIAVDSAKITNGKFVFSGHVEDSAELRFVRIEYIRPILLVLQPGQVELNIDSTKEVTIGGTSLNNALQAIKTKEQAFEQRVVVDNKNFDAKKDSLIIQKLNAVQLKALEKACAENEKKLSEQNISLYNDFFKTNISNPLGAYLLLHRQYIFDVNQLSELFAETSPEFKTTAAAKALKSRIELLKLTAIGRQFVDIEGQNFNGKEIALSDYAGKGKVVLLDFWASWCGPCARMMPENVETYKKFKNKGFEIVSVSLDEKKDDWMARARKLDMTWIHLSNLKGWKEDGAVAYGITYIPQTLLIDKTGKIVAHNLSGVELTNKIESLLK